MVLEHAASTVIGIEVKAAESVRSEDFRGLHYLANRVGDRFRRDRGLPRRTAAFLRRLADRPGMRPPQVPASRAGKIITLGSPLHGARIAAVGTGFDPAECPVACQQLAPGSALLTQLQHSSQVRPPWLSSTSSPAFRWIPGPAARRCSGSAPIGWRYAA